MRDTSARKRATPALSKEYQAVFENTGKAMVIVEEDATISLANAEFEKLSGYTKEEIEGEKSWTEFVARDDRKRVKEYHLLHRTDPMLAPRSFEFRFLDRQEKIRNIVLTIGQIPGTNKSMASLLDITDRRQAEETVQRDKKASADRVEHQTAELVRTNEALQAEIVDLKREVARLRESEERNRTLIDNIDLAINLIDGDHNIVMVNAAGTKQTNKPVSELIGKKCYQAFQKRDAVCPHCPGIQTMATGKLAEVETEGIRDDGSRYNVRIQAFPVFGRDGTVTGFIEIGEDITERKRTDEILQQSEERYRALAENIKLGINLIDLDHNILMVNASMSKTFNKSLSELIGKKCYQAFEKRDAVCPHCPGIQTIATGKPVEVETEGVRDDGSCFNVRLQAFPIFGQNGTVTSFIEVAEDISERKQAEELLQQERETFSTILQNALYGMGLIDRDGTYLYVNPEFTAITGYTLEDIPTGRDWMYKAYPDKEYRQKVIETWKKDIGSKGTINQVFRVVSKDGKIKEIEFRPTQLADGRAIVMLADVTERKQMTDDLRESEERFRRLVETIKVGLTTIDEKGVLTYVNDQFCKMLGYSVDEVIGHPTVAFYYDEETRKAQEEVFAKRREGMQDPTPYEIAWRTKDGRKVYTILTPTPNFDADGSYIGSSAIQTDITERKQMEERLQRYAAELEQSNEEVKNFAYIVSHDLRVPLVNLKGYTSELRSALEVVSPAMETALPHLNEDKRSAVAIALHEDVPEALEFITNSVSRMDSFINSVLILSRLGRRELKLEPIDMNALVQTTVENLSHQIKERDIKLTVGSLPEVIADRTSMEQIMDNILGNAVKYLDPERPGQIEVTAQTNNGEPIFRIRDNGRGIAEEDMHKVFAPFRRAGKQDTPGEGMGLAYVQTLVRRQDGRIWCESELGKGTTFAFTISNHITVGEEHVSG